MAHALLSPSSAHRWTVCPGSVALTKDMPEESSPFALEGTQRHEEAATLLEKGGVSESAELMAYVNYVRDLASDKGASMFIEHQIDLEKITGEAGAHGTADAIVFTDSVLNVIDLKWGKGVKVEAVGNLQLQIYALGALDSFGWLADFDTIRMTIVQPRISQTPITWETSRENLEKRRAHIFERAAIARDMAEGKMDLEFKPSEGGCKFCKARNTCKTYARFSLEAAGLECPFDDEPPTLTNEERAQIFEKVPVVKSWCEKFCEGMLSDALAGEKFPGFKLVLGRPGNRVWDDDKRAERIMESQKIRKDLRYTMKLITPTQAEKLAKKGELTEKQWQVLGLQIVRHDGKPTLVAESDSRPEYSAVAQAQDFPDLQ